MGFGRVELAAIRAATYALRWAVAGGSNYDRLHGNATLVQSRRDEVDEL